MTKLSQRKTKGLVDKNGRECANCGLYKVWEEFPLRYRKVKADSLANKYQSYCKECVKAQHPKYAAEYRAKLRREVILAYGSVCSCCGEDTPNFLTLDHVNNDGATHRRQNGLLPGQTTWAWARKNSFPNILQLLCWNCNCSKTLYGVCPHQKGYV